MFCPKCNAQIDDDSLYCKHCGAATAETKPAIDKKQNRIKQNIKYNLVRYKKYFLLMAIGFMLLVSGLIIALGIEYLEVGLVLVGVGLAIILVVGFIVSYQQLSAALKAAADKEAQRDKLMQDLLKKLEEDTTPKQ